MSVLKSYIKKDTKSVDVSDGTIPERESDILESEIKWDLGSIVNNKAAGVDIILVELFKILQEDPMKSCMYMPTSMENTAVSI